MPVNWFRRNTEEDPDNNQGEIKPEEFKKQLSDEFENTFKTYREEQDAKLNPVLEIVKQLAESRKAAEDAKAREQNKNRQEEEEITDDSDLWITNPAEASRRQNLNLTRQTQATAALLMRDRVLGKMEYYDGEIQRKVDELIEQQPLAQQSNTGMIRNAYYTILGQHTADIREGKIKERTANSSFSGSGTGGNAGDGKETPRKFSTEEQYMMKQFGMTADDVTKAERELDYV